MLVGKMAALVECLQCLHFVGVSTVARCPKNIVGVGPIGKLSNIYNVVLVVSHIQRISCQPEKTTYTVANPARGLLNRENNNNKKEKFFPPPPLPRAAHSKKIN